MADSASWQTLPTVAECATRVLPLSLSLRSVTSQTCALRNPEDHNVDQDGTAAEDPPSPVDTCAWNRADRIASDVSGSPSHVSEQGPHRAFSSPPYEVRGAKRHQRGRPVKYLGDPDAPGLDPEQRRQLLRRISNRESARRVRKRHQEEVQRLHVKTKDLQASCKALEIKCNQAEALEKHLTKKLRLKDAQVEESRRETLTLQSRVSELTMQLGNRDQKMLRLEGFVKAHECRAAAYTPRRMLSCPDAPVKPASRGLGQSWGPILAPEGAAEHAFDAPWSAFVDYTVGQGVCTPGQLHAGGQSGPTYTISVPDLDEWVSPGPCESLQRIFPELEQDLPDFSGASEGAACAQGSFMDMVSGLGLLAPGEGSGRTTAA